MTGSSDCGVFVSQIYLLVFLTKNKILFSATGKFVKQKNYTPHNAWSAAPKSFYILCVYTCICTPSNICAYRCVSLYTHTGQCSHKKK